jgi:DNA-binding GntR family transcriptional regulator
VQLQPLNIGMPLTETSPASALELIQSTSVARLIAEAISDQVVQGTLSPGTRLNEVALAQQFGVSRGPLREAIRLLEDTGLLRQEKNRGAFVREIRLAEAADIYDVRAGLDALTGRLLCDRITEADIATLRKLTQRMKKLRASDIDAFHQLNLAFHDTLVVMTGNATLLETYRKLTKQLVLFRRRNLSAPMAISNFAKEHSRIVDLLEQRDANACATALLQHAQGGKARMQQDGEMAGATHGTP